MTKPTAHAVRTLTFEVQLDDQQRAAASGPIPVVVSTDAPVEMPDGVEVLVHDADAVDLCRAPLPIIASHRGGQINVGLVEDLHVVGGQLRGNARFGERQEAAEYERDVRGKIIRSVSVGYARRRAKRSPDGVIVTTRWMPTHVAMVAEPADNGAGFYRHQAGAAAPDAFEYEVQADDAPASPAPGAADAAPGDTPAPQATATRGATTPSSLPANPRMEHTMDQQNQTPVQGDAAFRGNVEIIQRLSREYGQWLKPNDAVDAVASGADPQKFNDLIMQRMASGATDATTTAGIGATPKEAKQYSFMRAIQAQLQGAGVHVDAGLEREMSAAIAKATGREAEGIFIPADVMFRGLHGRQIGEKRDFNVGTSSQAGNLVQTTVDASMWTDVLRPALVLMQAGCSVLPGLRGNVAVPRKTVAGTLAMLTEIAAASETQPTTALPTLSPKRVAAYVEPSKQSIIQSEIGIEAMLRQDLVDGAAVLIENQGMNGDATGANARGIRNVSGIGSVVGGTNGLALAWTHVVGLESAAANANAMNTSRSAYVTNTKVRGTAKTVQKATNLPFIWDDGDKMNGHRALVSNNMPSNLTKGSSSGVCSSMVFGSDWSMFVLGLFGGLDITVDPYTLATTGQVRITLNQFFDWLCRQPGVFASIDDLLTP